jgi:phospholipase/carboxylesterase
LTLRAIAIPPRSGNPPKGIFVGLHGWGANAQDLAGLAQVLHLPDYLMCFPDAPFPHFYAPGGRMWYEIPMAYSFSSDQRFEEQAELPQSRQALRDWLCALEDSTGIPLQRTILCGFSQGGAMTIDVGSQLPLAALMVLSGYLHAPLNPQGAIAPVLMVHGRADTVVPLSAAQSARDALLEQGASVSYYETDGGHEISPVVMQHIQSFVEDIATPRIETA